MGLTKFLKEKLEGNPEEKQHRALLKETYTKNLRAAELEGAKRAGTRQGFKKGQSYSKPKSGLGMIGSMAEGAVHGINKGAGAFNTGMGMDDFAPAKGNHDLFDLELREERKSKKHHRTREFGDLY